ncbi:membrane protein insertase YidC [Candidatus Symbiobacter mobilis]|uniref:Membrane protein insertase YidC n=1 Tax=Candidatus Symbiobacter mobilis CR TaxID=946483 RepID=U5NBG3_9BURK|nr:membrane protein insertase YidC [Candidatus Symbiobacter mobilis]AGX88762.1 preprotein translocase subunit YidC [Candidatus Symbiobacter mobilis CR]
MNDFRRTALWVVLVFSLVMLWDRWQLHHGRQATFFPTPPASVAQAPGAASATSAPIPQATTTGSAITPAAPPPAQGEVVWVTTDVLKLGFDTAGGTLVHAEFLQHRDLIDANRPFTLLERNPKRVYLAQTGLISAAGGEALPTHQALMRLTTPQSALHSGGPTLELRFESPVIGGVQLVKTYTLQRSGYVIDVRHEVINHGDAARTPQLYLQLVRDASKPAGESSFYSTFTGPAVYTDAKKYQKIEFSQIDSNSADIDKTADNGYVAMVQHYFASAWLLDAGLQREYYVRKVDTGLYSVGMISPMGTLEPGAVKSLQARLFVGPQEETVLEATAPGLELVKDYGWLTILAKPLYWLLVQLHGMTGNWGWAIVALVVLLKIAFYWLNAKAYASMAKMKAVNPRIMELRERYQNDPQRMQQEMMRIYREERVNPMGGCLPILIQIPVFIALYWVLLATVEIRSAPWLGWIHDLSAPDPWYILPFVMTLTTILQTALNPIPPDPMQAKLMWIMPLAFSVMFFFFPSGLVLYWLTNNILSIAQQWIINTRLGVPPKFHLPKF